MLHETLFCSFGVGEHVQKNLVLRPRVPQGGSCCTFAKSPVAEACYAHLLSTVSPETIPGLVKILGQSLAVRPSHWESGITGLQVWVGVWRGLEPAL